MLKPICVVAVATERSLPSVVTCPTPPACCASASVHFTPNSRKLFSLMVTICAESSTCPTGRSICDTHCSSVLNAVLLSRSKGDWCVYRRSYSLWHSVASPRFRQLSGVGVLQSNIAIFQRQICLRPRLLRLGGRYCHSAGQRNAPRECCPRRVINPALFTTVCSACFRERQLNVTTPYR